MECLGGNGYVEERTLARLYREAPVNAIWEGSGNVMALDVLRALSKAEERKRSERIARGTRDLPGAAKLGCRSAHFCGTDPEAQARRLASDWRFSRLRRR